MNSILRTYAIILLVLFSFFHLGVGQRLFHAVPSSSGSCCLSTCGCPPSKCHCKHDATSKGVVYEAPECSLVKTTVNGAFGLMFFVPNSLFEVKIEPYTVSYLIPHFLIPNSVYENTLEKPPRSC